MDNAQKAIMIGVGLFVTIIIIAAVMLVVTPAVNLIKNATNQVSGLEESLQQQLTQQYDSTVVKGTDVIAAVNYYSGYDMVIEVQATAGGATLELGKKKGNGTVVLNEYLDYADANERTKISALSSSSSSTYVPSGASYKAELIRTASGDAVMGILFTRK